MKNLLSAAAGRFFYVPARVLAVLAVYLTALFGVPAAAEEFIPGPAAVNVMQVVDGDTLKVRAVIWLGHEVITYVRLDGVDAPELKGKCSREKALAAAATNFTAEWIKSRTVFLTDIHHDKYAGRILATVKDGSGADLADALIAAGLGRKYKGEKRRPWCEEFPP